jgi:RNA polymerase-binding transcription factor DksA
MCNKVRKITFIHIYKKATNAILIISNLIYLNQSSIINIKSMLEQSKIANFKKALLEKQVHLEKELSKIATKNDEGKWEAGFKDIARDDETNAIEVGDFTNDASVVNTLSKDLENIELALNKIASTNTYGQCETCQGNISPKRLDIFPEARNCMKCKQ